VADCPPDLGRRTLRSVTYAAGSWPEPQPEPREWSDDELAALALAADPAAPLSPDAVPLDIYLEHTAGPLPDWYMPAPTAGHSPRLRRLVILAVVAAFVIIEAAGLCSTYGQLPFH
jgi:hypothetical protein